MMARPSPAPEARARIRRLLVVAWLTLISAGVLIDHVTLSHLSQKTRSTAQNSDVESLQAALSTIEQQVALIKRQPSGISQSDFVASRQTQDERLGKLEQALDSSAHENDLIALQTRLAQLETRLAQTRQTPPPSSGQNHHRAMPPVQPAVIEPPFTPLGIEQRGGETFLSIAPAGIRSLTQVRVLHTGESESNWRLEALDGKTATFRVNGRLQPITVP